MSEPTAELKFEHTLLNSNGLIQLLVDANGATFADQVVITDAEKRTKCLELLVEKFPGIERDLMESELNRIGAEIADLIFQRKAEPDSGEAEEDESEGDDSNILVGYARKKSECVLFHVGAQHDAEAFACVKVDDHVCTWPVKSNAFNFWLRAKFYRQFKRPPQAQGFADALNVIVSLAIMDGRESRVFLRVAGHASSIYLDLGDDTWRVVQIDAAGWRVISSQACPVRFIRRRGMKPLPEPVAGGNITLLRQYVNCPTDDLWVLFAGSLPALFRPQGPYFVLVISGEQGSAKSTTAKRAREVIDPNIAAARRLPREDRDLMIAANNSYILVFDNLSSIPAGISDALCSLATGGGFGARQLFTDDDEKLIDAKRPVILNGIEEVVSRADLLDRAIILALPQMPEGNRQEERDLDAAFARDLPLILGALLDAASTAIRRFDSIKLSRKPRMLDPTRWCTAAEAAFGWAPETFLQAYMRNRSDAVAIALEASAVGPAVRSLMEVQQTWEGTPGALLTVLEKSHTDQRTRDRKDWPRTPKGMSDALKRIAPALRVLGVDCTSVRMPGGNRERRIIIRHVPVPPTGTEPSGGPAGARDGSAKDNRPEKTALATPPMGSRDGWDGRDASVASESERASEKAAEVDRQSSLEKTEPLSDRPATEPSQASQPSLPPSGDPEKGDSDPKNRDGCFGEASRERPSMNGGAA